MDVTIAILVAGLAGGLLVLGGLLAARKTTETEVVGLLAASLDSQRDLTERLLDSLLAAANPELLAPVLRDRERARSADRPKRPARTVPDPIERPADHEAYIQKKTRPELFDEVPPDELLMRMYGAPMMTGMPGVKQPPTGD